MVERPRSFDTRRGEVWACGLGENQGGEMKVVVVVAAATCILAGIRTRMMVRL